MKSNSKKMNDKKDKRKIIAGVLSAAMMLSLPGLSAGCAYAAEPSVTVDEATYVNLDYYGTISDVSVVKSCSLNGIKKFRDYGDYESVENMTSSQKPQLTTDGVIWNLGNTKDLDRFYFNCTMKNDSIVLPWGFDISYKLNGVPCKAEKLAGASGLVEIDIHAIPDENAEEYYKDNMMLQVATYVNMEDAYSIDAPGSQLQSIGTYKAVVFAALPGEDATFAIRIGSDSFESPGITMMMIPGTLQQMEDIKSLKEARETIGDSADAIYSSMDSILNTMESMKSGIEGLKEGTEEMEDARNTFSSGKDEMNEDADRAISDLAAINTRLKSLTGDFRDGQEMIKDLRDDIDDLSDTLNDLEGPLSDTGDSASEIKTDVAQLGSMLNTLNGQISTALTQLTYLAHDPSSGATNYDLASLQALGGLAGAIPSYSAVVGSLLSETVAMGNTTIEIVNTTKELIEKTDELNGTLGSYEDEMTGFLEDCEKFASEMSGCIDSTVSYLTYTKSLLQDSGDQLDAATEKSLKSMTALLGKSLDGLASVSVLRNANTAIRNTIDDELDKIDEDTGFINLDPDASFVSFTSGKNPAPASIQVILKTQEITTDDGNAANADLETEKEDAGLWGRIVALFEKIVETFA